MKLPPMQKNRSTSPALICFIASTTSTPCSLGLVIPHALSNLCKNASLGRSHIPTVRSPCTLECPRTGHGQRRSFQHVRPLASN